MTDYQTEKLHIVHTEASLGWGGQEIRILTEAQGMVKRGHRVTLLCPLEARIHAAAQEHGLPVEALPIGRKQPGGALALRRWLIANPADVINTHSSTDTWLAALACLFLKRPPPLVRTRHISAPIPNNLPTRWLYGTATRHIVTTGEALRRQLIQENGFDADRITSIPTGIASDHFVPGDQAAARARLGLPQGVPLIGIVATLRSWKGHRYLLEAFARLPADTGLVIIGDGPQRQNIEAKIRELGIGGDRVTLAGNQAEVVPWLQALNVFALPSYANEGVPQALVQAMLCGLPCVTTDTGSIGEAARDGETALIVKPEDSRDLRQGLERLLGDPALRARLGERARAHCLRQFSYDTMLDRMERVFARTAVANRSE
jgi:glycosyltransferase involved in cell wall biosynthesis